MEPPKFVDPHQLLTAPSAQNSTRLFHHTEMGAHLFASCVINTPRNCIKWVNQQFLLSHSTVFVFWDFLSYLCLQTSFPGKADVDSLHSGMAEVQSREARAGWPSRKASTDTNYPTEDKREARLALPFCEATVLHNHAYGQHWINTSQPPCTFQSEPLSEPQTFSQQKGVVLEHRKL